jgi:dienelactone hydrolase
MRVSGSPASRRSWLGAVMALPLLVASMAGTDDDRMIVRTTDSAWTFPRVTSLSDWEAQSRALRRSLLFRAGLWPMPPRTPLNAQVFGRIQRRGYTVEKVYFESVPGFFVTGNLYRPDAGAGAPFPAVLAPHGHAPYGRLEASEIFNEPARAASLARQGYVAFSYDMVGYNDSFQVPHDYADPIASLWSFSVLGLQLWNSIRALDFLASLPDVDPARLAAVGASGGGTQTFLLAAVDDRVKVSVPANMVSHSMQGGDNCENAAGLRLDHSNMEFAAMASPRPQLLVSADGDWTRDTPSLEFPAIRAIYALQRAEARLGQVQFHAPHNFNREGREASYAWLATWLKNTTATPTEAGTAIESPANLLVWYGRARPQGVDAAALLDYWRRLPFDPAAASLAVAADGQAAAPSPRLHAAKGTPTGVVLIAGVEDGALVAQLTRMGRAVYFVEPFREARNLASRYFTTYNRTADQIRVQDLLSSARALQKRAGPIDLVGTGPGGLWALAALAASRGRSDGPDQRLFRRVVADAGRFPTGDESAYLDRLFIPGFLRAGGFRALPERDVLIHNAGAMFRAPGDVREATLSAAEIAAWLRAK